MPLPKNSEQEMVRDLLSSDIGDISIVEGMVNDYERLESEEKTTEAIGKLREALKYCEKYKIICDNVKEASGVEDEWDRTKDLLVKIHEGLGDKIRRGIPSLETWKDYFTDKSHAPGEVEGYYKLYHDKAEKFIKQMLKLKDITKFLKHGIYYKDMISYLNDMISYLNDQLESGDSVQNSTTEGGGRKKRRKRRKTKRKKSKRKKSKKGKSKKK